MVEESSPSWGMRGLRKWLGTAPETRDELLRLVQDSRRFLEPDTVAMLEGVLDLPATKIREVMTPRTAIISLQEDDQLLDILDILIDSAHSRFPVFSADQSDNVVGILLAKDLLPFLTERNVKVDIRSLMRQPVFVPESARSDQVLRMLKNTQTHIAIVIDEYGSTSGLVTLEDILEEIVGDISDEYDEEEKQYSLLSDGSYIFEAKIQLSDFFRVVNVNEDEFGSLTEEVETLAGLLLEIKGDLPERREIIDYKQYRFQVLEADNRRILKVKYTLLTE